MRALQPFKVIFLTSFGGLRHDNGRRIDSINLSTEYDQFADKAYSDSGFTFKIERMKQLLDGLPMESSISITNPANLAQELFTHKGSGTLIRRGERVLRATSWEELDLTRLRALIESSFGRRVVDDYFERTRLLRAYISEHYRAAIILTEEDGVPYLDKFAVLDEAHREKASAVRSGRSCAKRHRNCSGARATTIRSTSSTTPSPTAASNRSGGRSSGAA